MTPAAWGSLAAVVAAVLLTAPPLARYMQAVYERGPAPGDRLFAPIERLTYRVCGVDPDREQRWFAYAMSVMAFGAVSVLVLYLIMRLQGVLPGNPTRVTGMEPGLAFNTAISFVTGTNWQAYAGENGVSLLAGAAGLVVAQFTAAGVSAGVALALVRALRGRTDTVGNFWRDLVRTILRVMLPISIVASLVLVSQGSIQNLRGFTVAHTVEHAVQVVPGGPGGLDGGDQAAGEQRRRTVRRRTRPIPSRTRTASRTPSSCTWPSCCRSRSRSCSAGWSVAPDRAR